MSGGAVGEGVRAAPLSGNEADANENVPGPVVAAVREHEIGERLVPRLVTKTHMAWSLSTKTKSVRSVTA